MGPSWGYLGPCWGHLGPSWGHVGPSWDHLGPSWGCLGPKCSQRAKIMIFRCCRHRRNRQRQKIPGPDCQKEKAGRRRCSPAGGSIRRLPLVGRSRRVRRPDQSRQGLCNLGARQYICLKSLSRVFYRPLFIPPRGVRIPSGSAKKTHPALF